MSDERNDCMLVFRDSSGNLSRDAYASKVPAGKTLRQAIRADLEKDFGYPPDKDFRVEEIKPYDIARNRHGQQLNRLLIHLSVWHKFATVDTRPAGLTIQWYKRSADNNKGSQDSLPTVTPDEFLHALYEAVAAERTRQGIPHTELASLAVLVDNRNVHELLSEKDKDDATPVIDKLSAVTQCSAVLHAYANPLITDFSKMTLNDSVKPRFDFTQPPKVFHVGNISVAFIVSRLDPTTGLLANSTK